METISNTSIRDSGKGYRKSIPARESLPWKFFLILILITLPFWIFGGNPLPIPIKLPVSALAAFNPMIAAFIVTYVQSGSDGVKELFRKVFDYRKIKNKIWYLPALLLTPLISLLAYAIMRWKGMSLPDPEIPILMVPVFFVVFFIFGIGEELGWMGYAIDPLQKRWGALNASLLLGFVWAIYHLIPDLQNGQTAGWIFWHRLGTVALRILMVWIYNNTGKSVFLAILFHVSDNLAWAFFPNYGSHYDPFVVGTLVCLVTLLVVLGWEGKTLTMKHSNYFLSTVLLCLSLAGLIPVRGNTFVNDKEIDFKAIDNYVTAKMRSAHIPGLALVIVKGDQIIFSKGYGQADPSGRPVTPQTSFIIGSVTKPLTALAVMRLVEEGKVELDAPVQQYIPWFRVADPEASTQITIHQLLNQTSGIPQPLTTQLATDQDDQALERNVRSLANVELIGPPGQSFTYSNGNWATLGMIIQTVSGQSYEKYIEQHIYGPLDMQNSFTSQKEALQNGMATGHRWWFGFPIPVTLPYNRTELPGGYLISSAEDMGHFLIAQLSGGRYGNGSVLSPDRIAWIHKEALDNPYGLGWESEQFNGHSLIYHIGGVPNFQSSLFFDPEARVGVFIAANACNALDAFSSPSGVTGMDGVTTRAMALSVLSMVMNEPVPEQGLGHGRLYLIFNLILLTLTVALLISLARMPGWYQQLAQHGIAGWSNLAWRTALISILHLMWPLFILYLNLRVIAWKVYVMMYQPDLGYWVNAFALTVLVKGLIEIALAFRVFLQTR